MLAPDWRQDQGGQLARRQVGVRGWPAPVGLPRDACGPAGWAAAGTWAAADEHLGLSLGAEGSAAPKPWPVTEAIPVPAQPELSFTTCHLLSGLQGDR